MKSTWISHIQQLNVCFLKALFTLYIFPYIWSWTYSKPVVFAFFNIPLYWNLGTSSVPRFRPQQHSILWDHAVILVWGRKHSKQCTFQSAYHKCFALISWLPWKIKVPEEVTCNTTIQQVFFFSFVSLFLCPFWNIEHDKIIWEMNGSQKTNKVQYYKHILSLALLPFSLSPRQNGCEATLLPMLDLIYKRDKRLTLIIAPSSLSESFFTCLVWFFCFVFASTMHCLAVLQLGWARYSLYSWWLSSINYCWSAINNSLFLRFSFSL